MARARVIAKVSGKPYWYRVQDDLGVQYDVQSATADFDFITGEEYRLLVPGGEYRPEKFRLLPHKTSKRWVDVAELGNRQAASATALYFSRDKRKRLLPHDEIRKIAHVFDGYVMFDGGGCASLKENEKTLYRPGDCVAVIRGAEETPSRTRCPKKVTGDTPLVAGFACDQTPRTRAEADPSCNGRYEQWDGYLQPTADLLNGGGASYPALNAPGLFSFVKQNPAQNEIAGWTAKVCTSYVYRGMPYGVPAAAWVGDRLKMESVAIEVDADYILREQLSAAWPRPIYQPHHWQPTPVVLAPPTIVKTAVDRKLDCGGKRLKMTVNLFTKDEKNHYDDLDNRGTGIQLPACLVLLFDATPYPDYLTGDTVDPALYTTGAGDPWYHTFAECNLDKKFQLVYSAPGSQDFSNLRLPLPGGAEGQYALIRSRPRRSSNPNFFYSPGTGYERLRTKYNVPMGDPENGFGDAGYLHTRCFDADGIDVTPRAVADIPNTGGAFPGYFEIVAQNNVTRNLYDDFLSAYPFMGNPVVNPSQKLPLLREAVFYVQGKTYRDTTLIWRANRSLIECQKIEFFHEKE